MKKVNLSLKKNKSTHNIKQNQKKISLYFTNTIKDEVSKTEDSIKVTNIVGSSITSGEICKKRKMEYLDSSQTKIKKYDNCPDEQNKQKQKQALTDESNVIDNIFTDSNVIMKKINIDQNNSTITECDYKENINTEKYKNICMSNNKETIENDVILKDNNSDKYIPSKEYQTNSVTEFKHNNFKNHKQIDISMLETYDINDFKDCFDEEWSIDNQINFNSFQRCIIVDVKREWNSTLITVKQEQLEIHNTIICSGFWKDANVQKNDIIIIQAKKENEQWIVDNSNGFLIVHPDVLISGTTVAGAFFCSRKAVLVEKFKKIEGLPYYEGDQSSMIIGNLVHQLLQTAIMQNIKELSDITKLVDSILQSRNTSIMLYESEMTFDACKQQVLTFVPKIFEFIQHYVKDRKQEEISNVKNNFKGRITHIHDIEENIWLPKLGIKGKVDITVEVKINSKRKIVPLEIKTGKPSFSLEHRGQIILYIMMMTLTRQETDTGLLLYLRDNIMQEISSGHPEKRDLILLRNTLANYFAAKSVKFKENSISDPDWKMLELPEPINHPSACLKCTYNTLCCVYLNKNTQMQLSDSHPLTKLSKQILDKFKPTHIDYVLHWISLLHIEESEQSTNNVMKYLWTLNPKEREAKKTCICNLKVKGEVIKYNSKYKHTLVRTNVKEQFSDTKIPYMEFIDNEYIVISTNSRINISAGFIIQRKEDFIIVLLDRDITKYSIDESFHIDKYSSSGLFSLNLANVGGLMGMNKVCENLRDIIIDRKPAMFRNRISRAIALENIKILQELNENQQTAILGAMSTNNYILIKGMPGTGKTQTLVALVELLHTTGHSVLITAHTNSAVDNILLKLLDKGIDFLRLGSSVYPLLKHKSEEYITSDCQTLNSIKAAYSSKNIVGVTCYGAHHVLLGRRTFDYCLVDESAQALQTAVLRPLYSAKKFVLIGDPDQLPPVVKSKLARKLGANESLFARLDNENNTVNLTKQYRMNKNIMYLANKLTYNDMLEIGDMSINNATLLSSHNQILAIEKKWIQKTLSSDINDSVIILDTGCTSNLKTSYNVDKYPESDQVNSNIWEALIISKLIQILVKMEVKIKNIGIIAPYKAHVNLLKMIITKDIEINTVDQYQGRDKEIIIYSCAKSLTNSKDIQEDLEILGDHRRLTVAITRAKHKLIIIADKNTLSRYSTFKKLFNIVTDKNIINLNNNVYGFSWENLLSYL